MASPLEAGASTIALIGLGNMGQAIGERLLDGGYALNVFNRTPGRDTELVARGASRAASPAAAFGEADVSVLSLADDEAVEEVAFGEQGLFAAAPRGKVVVDMSTISVDGSRRLADGAHSAGVALLRAPLSGNPSAVRAGTAAVVVSGPAGVARTLEPMLSSIAPTVRYVGEGEAARVLKLVLQILIGGTAELLAEAIVLGEGAGLERKQVLEVIGASVVGSTFVGYKTDPLVRDDYSATFTTAMMEKDVELVLGLAQEVGVDLPFTRTLRSLLEETSEQGHADQDFTALLLLLQARAGETAPATRKR